MPITNREQAKESGFAQVRAALVSFEGDVVSAEFGIWGGDLIDDEGKKIAPKEFIEIKCVNNRALEVTEELSMDITPEWNFRVNCSEFKGSFWIEKFLESTDRFKIIVPDGLIGKRIVWKLATQEAKDPKYNSTNFVIASVVNGTAPAIVQAPLPMAKATPAPVASAEDPMEVALNLAVGKTEAQFKSAISLHPTFIGSPLLNLAKAGAVTAALVNEGKLVLVENIYQKPQ